MNNAKERSIFLAIVCLVGLSACFFAYKHGPIVLAPQNAVPPGWTPPPAAPVTPPVAPQLQQPVVPPQNVPPMQPRQQQRFSPS
jgi:hypothetical protein